MTALTRLRKNASGVSRYRLFRMDLLFFQSWRVQLVRSGKLFYYQAKEEEDLNYISFETSSWTKFAWRSEVFLFSLFNSLVSLSISMRLSLLDRSKGLLPRGTAGLYLSIALVLETDFPFYFSLCRYSITRDLESQIGLDEMRVVSQYYMAKRRRESHFWTTLNYFSFSKLASPTGLYSIVVDASSGGRRCDRRPVNVR